MNSKVKTPLKIIPLGGLGEIGLNMMVFEQGPDLIAVDCGLMFPGETLPGIDYVIPDFTYLLDHGDQVRGVILTHGHEDHIGALPFLLQQLKVPVYATPLTLGLVRQKLIEHGLAAETELHEVRAGDVIQLGSFEIELIRVSHSVADCLALALKTGIGNVIHTGDFKLDPTPVNGEQVDLGAFARYGELGVTLLLSDSTNVENSGYTLSEREVGQALLDVFAGSPGRVIVAMFASNVHRIQQVLDAAARFSRRVAIIGRSMVANTRIAEELGYLRIDPGLLLDTEDIHRTPDRELCILTTGTQGEPLSALSRMARDEHKQVAIRPGDTVVLSSRFIPGNENAINRLINEFYRRGAEVIYEKTSDIHVSGHASREELKLMIALTRPQYFIPIHGEYRHLVKHAQLAVTMGVPRERVMVVENGDLVTFNEIGGERLGRVEAGKQVVDGVCIADSKDAVLHERRRLAKDGVILAVVRVDLAAGRLTAPLRLESQGLLFADEVAAELEAASLYVEAELAEVGIIGKTVEQIEVAVRASLKRYMKKSLARFPVIVPLVITD